MLSLQLYFAAGDGLLVRCGASAVHGGCPLAGKKCPYFEQHKQDASMMDVLLSDSHECPLANTAMKSDKAPSSLAGINWDNAKCPLAGKCPYYESLKTDPSKAYNCPVLKGCPHFQHKDGNHQVHHDHNASKASSECPYLNMERAKKEARQSGKGKIKLAEHADEL
eukprot:jgi/Hompol1/6082/HPOL_000613-RA